VGPGVESAICRDGILPAVNKTHIDLAKDRGRGIDALKGSTIPAVFCDAVRVQLKECVMLFVSGKLGVKPDGTLGRTMREQTQQVLENIRELLQHEGATMDDIVRVRVYVTQVDAASLRDIHEVRSKFWTAGKYPASTLVRVDQLVRDGALIEIDADAVVAS
jgi:enamine deaminase RidA (YjgF/YER057c/UK114 family)